MNPYDSIKLILKGHPKEQNFLKNDFFSGTQGQDMYYVC